MSILPGKISDFLKVAVAAAGRGDLQTVQAVLAQKPAWITRIGSHGRTMLWEAAYRGRLAMVDYLLDQGADIHACGCHFTPLLVEISPYCAARYKRHHAVADRLLTRGAATDIYTAAFLGESDAVADYLDREPGLAIAEKAQHDSSQRMTVLHYAVSAGHLAIVSMLLAR
ncbi:MAG: ankyrin repeat domain-containing protein, partial [Gemmatimonadota bacterium]|nr:ankyrin repeat domain-containing protein [Gemmatimonadota bacterium]